MIFLCFLAVLYFLPTVVASHRGHPVTGILLLNLFFGWTGLGWMALLVWALASAPRYVMVTPYSSAYGAWRRY